MRHRVKPATLGETVRLAALVVVFGLSTAMPSRSLGQQPAAKEGVGQRVVPKHRNVALQNGGGKPARAIKPDIYRVEQVNRGWFLLKPDGASPGWVAADQIVSVEQAVAFFSNAISKDPHDPHNYAMRALVLLTEREDPQHALADCDEAIRLAPKDPVARSIRGAVYSAMQNYDKAIADFDEVVRLQPNDGSSYHDRGAARMFQRDFDRAIADFNKAIQLDPKNTDALNGRAWFRATCPVATYRDGAQAVASATQACELTGWKDAGILDTLAAAYAESGDFASALKWQAKAIERETDANEKTAYGARLQLYQAKTPYRDGKP